MTFPRGTVKKANWYQESARSVLSGRLHGKLSSCRRTRTGLLSQAVTQHRTGGLPDDVVGMRPEVAQGFAAFASAHHNQIPTLLGGYVRDGSGNGSATKAHRKIRFRLLLPLGHLRPCRFERWIWPT